MSEHPERWLSALYRASSREEPPRSLDACILKAARKDSRGWLSRLMTWQTPLAAAAVIVVAVTLVIAVRDDPVYLEQQTLRSNDSRSGVETKKSRSTEYRHDYRPPPPAAGERPAQTESKPTTRIPASPIPEQASPMAKEEAAMKHAAIADANKSEAVQRDAGKPATSAPSTAPPAAFALERGPDASNPLRGRAVQAAPASPEAKSLGKLSAPSESETGKRAADGNQAAQRMRQDAASVEGSRRLEAREADPAARDLWLENILKLRNQGRLEEARESLAAFKKRFPDYPLPAVLKDF